MKYKKVKVGQLYYSKRHGCAAIAKSKRAGTVYVELQNGRGTRVQAGELSHYDDVKDII